MKKVITFVLFISALLAYAQQKTFNMPKNFKADINYMVPMKYEPRSVSGYSLEMRGDSVFVALPYIGEMFTAPVPGSEGMTFDNKVENLEYGTTKKGAHTISFETSNGAEKFRFYITAFDNNTIDIDLTPSNATSCSYRGNWEEAEKR